MDMSHRLGHRTSLYTGLIVSAWLVTVPAFAGDITVTVTGPDLNSGQVGCALHKSANSFPMGHQGVKSVWRSPVSGGAVCVFRNVPAGRYAIAVSHDLNGNRKTDTNMLGIPKEGWGVSGNLRPTMRAPRFEEAVFDVGAEGARLNIEVKK